MLAYDFAGGSLVFLAFLLVFGLAIAFAYYSRAGSEISMRPGRGDRGDTDPSAFSDRSQPVASWSRGTGGSHKRNLPPPRAAGGLEDDIDPTVREGLARWREKIRSPYTPRLATPVDPARDHVRGPEDAVVTVVGYTDFECPSCREADQAMKALEREFGGRVRYAFRHFPLSDSHRAALPAAETAEWAAGQSEEGFWQVHDAIYKSKHAPTEEGLRKLVAKLGMDPEAYREALTSGRLRARVAEDFETGVESGVNGTPTLFVGEERYDDDFDVASLRKALLAAGA